MKNVIKKIIKFLSKIGDINLSILLFIFYILLFGIYKIFNFFKKDKIKKGWQKAENFDIENKYLQY